VTLASAPLGVPLLLGRADLPAARRLRLAELGLRAGATVTVMRRTAGGGRIVAVGDARVAVGRNVLLQVPAVPVPAVAAATAVSTGAGVAPGDRAVRSAERG